MFKLEASKNISEFGQKNPWITFITFVLNHLRLAISNINSVIHIANLLSYKSFKGCIVITIP